MTVNVNYSIELDQRDKAVLNCLNDNLAKYFDPEFFNNNTNEVKKEIARVKDAFVEAEIHRRLLSKRVIEN